MTGGFALTGLSGGLAVLWWLMASHLFEADEEAAQKWDLYCAWKAAFKADVRSFLAVEPNTPPNDGEEDGWKEDFDEDDDTEEE